MGKYFRVVPLCSIKSQFVAIDSRILYRIMKEIRSEFDVWKIEFAAESRETHLKNISSISNVSKRASKRYTGMIETDGVAIGVHYRRLKVDRRVQSSSPPSVRHGENKAADPAMQEVPKNDFVVGACPRQQRR
jgi:hypothetical protein